MRKKCSFTLIEVVLSLTLIALLLSTLLFWFHHLSALRSERETQKISSAEVRFLHEKLSKILPKTTSTHFFTTETDGTTIIDQSLVFTFDYGPQMDPRLSDEVLGRLYLDKQTHTLCLGLWPTPEQGKEPHLTLPLFDRVEQLSFDFYFPPDPFALTVSPKEVGEKIPNPGWQTSWDANYEVLPAFMKLKLTKEDGTIEVFPYHIRPMDHPIVYRKLEIG